MQVDFDNNTLYAEETNVTDNTLDVTVTPFPFESSIIQEQNSVISLVTRNNNINVISEEIVSRLTAEFEVLPPINTNVVETGIALYKAAENIPAYYPVYLDSLGEVAIARADTLSHFQSYIGFSLTDITQGTDGNIKVFGVVSNPNWMLQWEQKDIFIASQGGITQTPNEADVYTQRVGEVLSAHSILIIHSQGVKN